MTEKTILTSNVARCHCNYSTRSLAGSSIVVISQNVLLNCTSYVSKLLMLCFLPPLCQKDVTKSSFASPQALLWTSLQIRKCGKANLLRPPVAVTRTTHLAEQHANKMHTWSQLIKWQASSLRKKHAEDLATNKENAKDLKRETIKIIIIIITVL